MVLVTKNSQINLPNPKTFNKLILMESGNFKKVIRKPKPKPKPKPKLWINPKTGETIEFGEKVVIKF